MPVIETEKLKRAALIVDGRFYSWLERVDVLHGEFETIGSWYSNSVYYHWVKNLVLVVDSSDSILCEGYWWVYDERYNRIFYAFATRGSGWVPEPWIKAMEEARAKEEKETNSVNETQS